MSAPDIRPGDEFTIPGERKDTPMPDVLDEIRSLGKDDPEILGLVDELTEAMSGMDEEDEAEAREDMAFLKDLVGLLRTIMSTGEALAKAAVSHMAEDVGTAHGICNGKEWVFTKQGLEDAVQSVQASAVRSFAKTILQDTGGRIKLSDSQKAAVEDMTKSILETLGQGWDE